MRFEDVLILALALSALLTIWFHEDSVFSFLKARLELCDNWLGRLMNCRLCLSTQAPFWGLLLPFYVPSLFLDDPWNKIVMVPVYSLAATTTSFIVIGLIARMTPYFSILPEEPVNLESPPESVKSPHEIELEVAVCKEIGAYPTPPNNEVRAEETAAASSPKESGGVATKKEGGPIDAHSVDCHTEPRRRRSRLPVSSSVPTVGVGAGQPNVAATTGDSTP